MSADAHAAMEARYESLAQAVRRINVHIEKHGNLEEMPKAALALGLEPAFVHHLVALVTGEKWRRRNLTEQTTIEDLAETTAILAGIAGSMQGAKRDHFLAAVYYFTGCQESE